MSHFSSVQLSSVVSPIERPETSIIGQVYRQIGSLLQKADRFEEETERAGKLEDQAVDFRTCGAVIRVFCR